MIMKKTIIISCLSMLFAYSAFAQPISDRAVIPVGVTLVEILRVHVINGGNIEFVFNDINDYINGITNSSFYNSDVTIASSTKWQLHFGAEDALGLKGTDNPVNTIALNNVGVAITWTGTNSCCIAADQVQNGVYGTGGANTIGVASGLQAYTGTAADLLLKPGAA